MRSRFERWFVWPALALAIAGVLAQAGPVRAQPAQEAGDCSVAISVAVFAAAMADDGIKPEQALAVMERALEFTDEGQARKLVQGIVLHAYDKTRPPLPKYVSVIEFACRTGQLAAFIKPEI